MYRVKSGPNRLLGLSFCVASFVLMTHCGRTPGQTLFPEDTGPIQTSWPFNGLQADPDLGMVWGGEITSTGNGNEAAFEFFVTKTNPTLTPPTRQEGPFTWAGINGDTWGWFVPRMRSGIYWADGATGGDVSTDSIGIPNNTYNGLAFPEGFTVANNTSPTENWVTVNPTLGTSGGGGCYMPYFFVAYFNGPGWGNETGYTDFNFAADFESVP